MPFPCLTFNQILVTVRSWFEIMLLSPTNEEWAKKIEYVIFDEVHCIGGCSSPLAVPGYLSNVFFQATIKKV